MRPHDDQDDGEQSLQPSLVDDVGDTPPADEDRPDPRRDERRAGGADHRRRRDRCECQQRDGEEDARLFVLTDTTPAELRQERHLPPRGYVWTPYIQAPVDSLDARTHGDALTDGQHDRLERLVPPNDVEILGDATAVDVGVGVGVE